MPSFSIRHNNGSTATSCFAIGTFNIRGLSSATKGGQLSEDRGRLHVDILCQLETKFPGYFKKRSYNYRIFGLPSQSRHYGFAFAVATHMEGRTVCYWSVSERTSVIQLRLTSNSLMAMAWPDVTMCQHQQRR